MNSPHLLQEQAGVSAATPIGF